MSLYNAIMGENPLATVLLATLGLRRGDVPRYRDVVLSDDGKRIGVYTRMGGGNRDWHKDTERNKEEGPGCGCAGCMANFGLAKHPRYLSDEDDDFDCTYATYWFSTPDEVAEDVAVLAKGATEFRGAGALRDVIEKMNRKDTGDPRVLRAFEAIAPVIEQIAKFVEGKKP